MTDWEDLDDESTYESAEETASLTSCLSEDFSIGASAATNDSVSAESGFISDASQATIVTKPTQPTVQTTLNPTVVADKQTFEAITKATVGLKAVKADDAEVPVYLWDNEIIGDDPSERKKRALNQFRQLGLQWLWRMLFGDCLEQLRSKFGEAWEVIILNTPTGEVRVRVRDWELLPLRPPLGKLSRVGKEREAMQGLLWHAAEASWFEYNAGSRLYHFRFPLRYQCIAHDGVPIFFERPGPSTMQRQPEFADPHRSGNE